jgi:hypothetical protein
MGGSATDLTRTLQDLDGEAVHVASAIFTAKTQQSWSSSHLRLNWKLNDLTCDRYSDPEIGSSQEFLAKYGGRKLAVVNGSRVVKIFRLNRFEPI